MDLGLSASFEEQPKADRRDIRRFATIGGGRCAPVFAAATGLGVPAVKAGNRTDHRFMTPCMEDHKEYGCIALWRASAGKAPDIIVIPSGR